MALKSAPQCGAGTKPLGALGRDREATEGDKSGRASHLGVLSWATRAGRYGWPVHPKAWMRSTDYRKPQLRTLIHPSSRASARGDGCAFTQILISYVSIPYMAGVSILYMSGRSRSIIYGWEVALVVSNREIPVLTNVGNRQVIHFHTREIRGRLVVW